MYTFKNQFELIDKAQLLYETGRYQLALDTLQELVDEPNLFNLSNFCILYANCCLSLNDYNKAFEFTLAKLNEHPNNPNLYYLMSSVCNKMNKNKEGLEYILKAIELEPNEGKYHTVAASIYLQMENYVQSDYHLSISEEQYPEDEYNIFARTAIHIAKHESKKASIALKRGLDLHPRSTLLQNLYTHLKPEDRPNLSTLKELSFNALDENPFDNNAKQSLLFILKNNNPFVRFFVSHGFQRFEIKWTPWTIILMIVFWKAALLWGVFGLLYLLITWSGTALFYTIIRKHHAYKFLLSKQEKYMSNTFIVVVTCAAVVVPLVYSTASSLITVYGTIAGFLFILFTSISYFEIETKQGKTAFAIFMLIAVLILLISTENMKFFGMLSLLLSLIYAFLFALKIAFK
ncbi:MAG: hypothetical protein H6568_06595 [Lewinellaceae bacterium]|nr:hypothetical protein [Lewinellaceae bacterium]